MGTETAHRRETARALEVILSRLRLDSATAHVLKGHLGHAREAVERAEAEAKRLHDEGPWPNGCTKRRSCARNKACMYGWNGSCRHEGRNIVAEIEASA